MQTILPNPYAIPGIKSPKTVNPLTLPVQAVVARAAIYFNCSTADIKRKCREREVIDRRVLICLYLRSRGYTLKAIGDCFRQDHTTIIHAVTNAKNLVKLYTQYQKEYNGLAIYLDT